MSGSYHVRPSYGVEGGFVVCAYLGSGSSSVVESKAVAERALAEDWARRANAGEKVPEAAWGCFADD